MPIFCKDDQKVLLIHIPKTGGISINHVFARAGWHISLEGNVLKHDYYKNIRGSLNHLCYAELEEYYNFEDFDFVFSVVRNPYHRAVSEYHWQKQTQDFSQWFKSEIDQFNNSDRYGDNHFLPQCNFVGAGTTKTYQLEQGFDSIVEDLSKQVQSPLSFNMLPANESIKSISVDDIDKQLVYSVYKQDFERFGYDSSN